MALGLEEARRRVLRVLGMVEDGRGGEGRTMGRVRQ